MTRIRRSYALPETQSPHVEPAAASRGVECARAAATHRRGPGDRAARSRSEAAWPRAVSCMFGFTRATKRPKRRVRRGKSFPPCKPLKTNETELESRQILPRSEEPMQRRRTSRRPKKSRDPASILGVVRGKSAARRMPRRRNFPIRKPLKRLETEKESGGLSLLEPASDSGGFIP
jgi:hypothetical protein